MQMGGIMGGFYRVSEWIMRFAYVNILWGLFTLAGLVLFGFMPATVAMFTVIRKWLMGETDIPVFKTFFLPVSKKDFLSANLIGLILGVVGVILYVDFRYLTIIENPVLSSMLVAVLIMVSFVYVIVCLYIVPVFVHYDLKLVQHLKYAAMIGVMNLHITITMLVAVYLLYLLFITIPGLIPFFSSSLLAFIFMGGGYLSFVRLENKKKKLEEKEALAEEN